jgi:hypothetical protein
MKTHGARPRIVGEVMRTSSTPSIVARGTRRRPDAVTVISFAIVVMSSTVGCLGHAGDAERVRAHPSMNESAKPSNEPMPASVDPGGYGEEYPERRR